jgi:hypothetical protein
VAAAGLAGKDWGVHSLSISLLITENEALLLANKSMSRLHDSACIYQDFASQGSV